MDILISCNDNYGMPTMVMLTSLVCNNPCIPGEHTVYMLESELSDEWSNKIESLLRDHCWGYVRLHVPTDLFSAARTKPYISKETYYRLIAYRFLPENVRTVLWLDSDILVRKDLGAIFDISLDKEMAAACGYGHAMQVIISDNAKRLGMSHPETYFNAGVMLMDLPECRNAISEDSIMQIATAETTSSFMFPGQDTVNLIFDGKVKILDYRIYNCMIHCIETAEDLQYAKDNAAIVHFAGEAKPWKFDDIHFSDEWAEWYRVCFGETAVLKRMSYFRLKALFSRQRGIN